MYYNFTADTLRDSSGDSFAPLGGGGSVDASATIIGGMWITDRELLGGTYGFSIYPGVTNNALELPALQSNTKTSTGFADLYIQPIILGWNKDRADIVAGLGISGRPAPERPWKETLFF